MKICKYCHKVIKEEDIKAENQKYHKGAEKMAKDDKELGEWIATSIVSTTTIKQFKHGFSIKKRGEDITEKIKVVTETTPKDMADIIASILIPKKR